MKRQTRFVGIDLLRFATAIAVMVFHLGFWSWILPATTPAAVLKGAASYPELIPFVWWGRFGVDIFFVISGFVIAYSASSASARSFVNGRVLRLVPGALVCATLTLSVALLIELGPAGDLLVRYIRTVAFWPFGPWIDGVYWTLGIELSFYGLVLLLLLMGRFSWIEGMVVFIGTLSAATWLSSYIVTGPSLPALLGFTGRAAELLLFYHGASFATGAMIWIIVTEGATIRRCICLVFLMIGGAQAVYSSAANLAATTKVDQSALVPTAIWCLSVIIIVASARADERISARMGPHLLAWTRRLGLSTYPLYLIHDIVGAALLKQLIVYGVEKYAALCITCVVLIAVSATVLIALENWVRRRMAKLAPVSSLPRSGERPQNAG